MNSAAILSEALSSDAYAAIDWLDYAFICRAAEFAAAAHEGQERKHVGGAYISHPAAVAEIAARAGLDVNQIAAAWLHDVVEDCDVSVGQIRDLFGDDVAQLVQGLSKPYGEHEGSREFRNEQYALHLAAQCSRVHSIKAADILHNSASVVDVCAEFAARYLAENMAIMSELLQDADAGLLARLDAQLRAQLARIA